MDRTPDSRRSAVWPRSELKRARNSVTRFRVLLFLSSGQRTGNQQRDGGITTRRQANQGGRREETCDDVRRLDRDCVRARRNRSDGRAAFTRRPGVREGPGAKYCTHVGVVDGTGTPPKQNQTIVITGNRVTAVGSTGDVTIPPPPRFWSYATIR